MRGDILQEGRGRIRLAPPMQTTAKGINQIHPFLSSGYPHIAQPPLFFHLFRVGKRTEVGQNPFFHTHDKDHRELQSLGLMQGDQRDHLNPLH